MRVSVFEDAGEATDGFVKEFAPSWHEEKRLASVRQLRLRSCLPSISPRLAFRLPLQRSAGTSRTHVLHVRTHAHMTRARAQSRWVYYCSNTLFHRASVSSAGRTTSAEAILDPRLKDASAFPSLLPFPPHPRPPYRCPL